MVKRFKFSLENEVPVGELTDPAMVLTEGEAEIANLETELGQVSLEGERLFMAHEALTELAEITRDITEPTETELSLIQNNIENIARINDEGVEETMPEAQNVVSIESYGKGRGNLAIEEAAKSMWQRIKEWFAKMWGTITAWVTKSFSLRKNKAKSIADKWKILEEISKSDDKFRTLSNKVNESLDNVSSTDEVGISGLSRYLDLSGLKYNKLIDVILFLSPVSKVTEEAALKLMSLQTQITVLFRDLQNNIKISATDAKAADKYINSLHGGIYSAIPKTETLAGASYKVLLEGTSDIGYALGCPVAGVGDSDYDAKLGSIRLLTNEDRGITQPDISLKVFSRAITEDLIKSPNNLRTIARSGLKTYLSTTLLAEDVMQHLSKIDKDINQHLSMNDADNKTAETVSAIVKSILAIARAQSSLISEVETTAMKLTDRMLNFVLKHVNRY